MRESITRENKMGFSSEFHGTPLRFLKRADRVFQKEIESFLQRTDLPEFTFQFVKPSSEATIKKQVAFWWERPANFRAYQLILNDTWAACLVNSRDTSQVFTARIPLLRQEVKRKGPIVLECLLDETDRILWIVDVLHMKGVNTQKRMDFLQRYKLANEVLQSCIQPHAVLQSCEVKIVPWRSIEELDSWEPTPKCCLELMCLEAGWRRFVWKEEFTAPTKQPRAVPVQQQQCMIIDEEPIVPQDTLIVGKPEVPVAPKPYLEKLQSSSSAPSSTLLQKNHKVAFLLKDPKANGPDLYILQASDGVALGSAAIRSMPLRLALRKAVMAENCLVHISWYEAFHKYEVTGLVVGVGVGAQNNSE
jgi:hypothetical protein